MPPERTKELVDQLRAWYKAGTTRQKDLANLLGLTPQALNEILAGRNQPNSETALRILEFLKEQSMIQTPTLNGDIRVDDAGLPVTLLGAKQMLKTAQETVSHLQSEIARLKASGASVAPPASITLPKPQAAPGSAARTPTAARVTGPLQPDALPGIKSAKPLPVSVPAEPKQYLPSSCVSPFLVNEYLKVQPTETVRQLMATTKGWQQALVYAELKKRQS
jgi:DNA-binding XRE family transcriptional regulator